MRSWTSSPPTFTPPAAQACREPYRPGPDVASATLRNRLPDRLRAALAGHTMRIAIVTVGELMK